VRRILQLLSPRFLSPRFRRRRARLLAELHTRTESVTRPGPPRRVGRRTPNGGAYYRTLARQPITPDQVRDRRFADRTRRGCDPGEVRAFQHVVADEIAALRAELAGTRDENLRIKTALREWQSTFRPGTGMAA
jgi:DivIVA domain-containing protein